MKRYKTLFAGMLAVALGFGIAIPLGFWLRPRYSSVSDQVFGTILVAVLLGISTGVMRLLSGPLWPRKKHESLPLRRPDPDSDPNQEWSIASPLCRTGYEISLNDFRRLVSEPSSQPVIARLLKDWFRYEIVGQGTTTVVHSQEGHVVGFRDLHTRIQRDASKQYTIYCQAMDCWR